MKGDFVILKAVSSTSRSKKRDRGLCPGDLYDLAEKKGIDVESQDFLNKAMELAGAAHIPYMDQLKLKIMHDWMERQ